MNNLIPVIALALLPLGLSAQTKSAVRKPTTSTARTTAARPTTVRKPTTVAKPSTSVTKATAPQPAPATAVATASSAPAVQDQPAPTPQPKPQTTTASRPTPKPVQARSHESRTHFGFRVGGNSSTFSGVDPSGLGEGVKLARVTGFHAGVLFNFGGPSFSVQPELLYSQYGVKFAAGSDYLQLKYNVVEVPVLLKASFGQPNLRFFINAGPVATYAVNGTLSVRESGQSQSQALDMSNEGRLSYGATGGIGIALQAGSGKIQLEGRYNYLISGQNDDGSQTKPQNAMLSIGYLIPIGR